MNEYCLCVCACVCVSVSVKLWKTKQEETFKLSSKLCNTVRPVLGEWKGEILHCNTYSTCKTKAVKSQGHSQPFIRYWCLLGKKRCRTISLVLMAVIHPWNNVVYLTTNLVTSHPRAAAAQEWACFMLTHTLISKRWSIRVLFHWLQKAAYVAHK